LPALKSILALKESDLQQDMIITGLKNGHADLERANRWLLDHEISFLGIEIAQPTLEDVFLRLTDENGKEAC
jgi:ABC-2 type transport system ATP-binding protein